MWFVWLSARACGLPPMGRSCSWAMIVIRGLGRPKIARKTVDCQQNISVFVRTSGDISMDLDAKAIISRMLEATGLRSERELSLALGLSESALGNRRRTGGLPLEEAAQISCEKSVSLDWLIFGESRAPLGIRESGAQYDSGRVPEEIVREVVLQVSQLIEAEGLRIQPAKLADLIVLVCREVQREAAAGQSGNPTVAGDRLLAYLKLAA